MTIAVKALLTLEGVFSSAVTYNVLDVVTDAGSSWVSKTSGNIGNDLPTLPTTFNTHWQLLAEGEKGSQGNPFTYADFTPSQLTALKGETGDAFVFADFSQSELDALKGETGDAFVYADFTTAQLANLKGEKGDAFVFADFTSQQIIDLKGEKGDAFVYTDFTTAQLALLKGETGTAGANSISANPTGTDGADLTRLEINNINYNLAGGADDAEIGIKDVPGEDSVIFNSGVAFDNEADVATTLIVNSPIDSTSEKVHINMYVINTNIADINSTTFTVTWGGVSKTFSLTLGAFSAELDFTGLTSGTTSNFTISKNEGGTLNANIRVVLDHDGTVVITPATETYLEVRESAVVTGIDTKLGLKADKTQVLTNVPMNALFTDTQLSDEDIANLGYTPRSDVGILEVSGIHESIDRGVSLTTSPDVFAELFQFNNTLTSGTVDFTYEVTGTPGFTFEGTVFKLKIAGVVHTFTSTGNSEHLTFDLTGMSTGLVDVSMSKNVVGLAGMTVSMTIDHSGEVIVKPPTKKYLDDNYKVDINSNGTYTKGDETVELATETELTDAISNIHNAITIKKYITNNTIITNAVSYVDYAIYATGTEVKFGSNPEHYATRNSNSPYSFHGAWSQPGPGELYTRGERVTYNNQYWVCIFDQGNGDEGVPGVVVDGNGFELWALHNENPADHANTWTYEGILNGIPTQVASDEGKVLTGGGVDQSTTWETPSSGGGAGDFPATVVAGTKSVLNITFTQSNYEITTPSGVRISGFPNNFTDLDRTDLELVLDATTIGIFDPTPRIRMTTTSARGSTAILFLEDMASEMNDPSASNTDPDIILGERDIDFFKLTASTINGGTNQVLRLTSDVDGAWKDSTFTSAAPQSIALNDGFTSVSLDTPGVEGSITVIAGTTFSKGDFILFLDIAYVCKLGYTTAASDNAPGDDSTHWIALN